MSTEQNGQESATQSITNAPKLADLSCYSTSRSAELSMPTGSRPQRVLTERANLADHLTPTQPTTTANNANNHTNNNHNQLQQQQGTELQSLQQQQSTSTPVGLRRHDSTNAAGSGQQDGGDGKTPTRTVSGRFLIRTPSKIDSFIDPNSPMTSRIHRIPLKSLEQQLHTSTVTGLKSDDCEKGLNQITMPSPNIVWKLAKYVFGGFNLIMWLALILSVLSYQPLGGKEPQIVSLGVAVVLLITIIVSAAFYARVDFAANKMMSAMRSLVANNCIVIREGIEQQIPAIDVCVGDVLVLSLGQRVAADARLIETSSDLAFDRSLLTGESDPVAGATTCTDKNILETKNIALSSSFVLRGTAKAVVYSIGDDTVIGRIMKLAADTKPKLSPLQKEIQKFTVYVTGFAISSFLVAILLWGVWQRTSYPGFNTAGSAIINAIGCLAALCPEGLPIAFALSLSIIASKMAESNVLVKNLSTIETLGCMTFLASDKTNTLTTSKMTVQRCITLEQNLDFSAASQRKTQATTTAQDTALVDTTTTLAPEEATAITVNTDGSATTPAIDSLSSGQQDKLFGMKGRQSAAVDARHSSFHSASDSTNSSANQFLTRASSHHYSTPKHGLQEALEVAFATKPLPTTYAMHRVSSLCCSATFLPQIAAEEIPIEDRQVNGDPTDTAVLRFSHAGKQYLGVTTPELEYHHQYTTLFTLPFNSNNKFMATVVIETENPEAKPMLLLKGGADIVMNKCAFVLANTQPTDPFISTDAPQTPTQVISQGTHAVPMDSTILTHLTDTKNQAAAEGFRVLALAQIEIDSLQLIPDLAPIVEGPNDLDENNESDSEDEPFVSLVNGNPNDLNTQTPTNHVPDQQQPDPTSPSDELVIPTAPQPKARYVYPQDWESFCLQLIARHQCTLLGCLGIMDPPRPDVPDTVATLQRAGVTVAMVTGDFQLTAESIARQVNIITCPKSNVFTMKDVANLQLNWEKIHKYPTDWFEMKPETEADPAHRRAIVLNGTDVATLGEQDWHFICSYFHEFVFARTTPEHKQIIVESFKARGRVVAVTGDGVNDVAALKSADVGVSMGAGADLAKDAASIVLIDNSFSSLVVGLIYGRLVFANLRKIIMFLMSCGAFVEFLAVVVNILLGTPLPLVSFFQIIFCCTSDIAVSIAMMFEGPEGDILNEKPRDVRKDHLVDWRWLLRTLIQFTLVSFIGSIGMWFLTMHDYGIGFLDVILAFNDWKDGFKGFTKAQLKAIATRASAAYYISMIWCNIGNCLAIRTSVESIFNSNPFWGPNKNIKLPICFLISICFAVFFVFCPGLPELVDTHTVKAKYWFIPMTFPIGIILIDECRKYVVRNFAWAARFARKNIQKTTA